jgi:hypothetical protein
MLIIDPCLPDQKVYKMPQIQFVYALPNNCADYIFLTLPIYSFGYL